MDQLAELAVGQLRSCEALVKNAFELEVLLQPDHRQRFVDALADAVARRLSQRAASSTQKSLTSR